MTTAGMLFISAAAKWPAATATVDYQRRPTVTRLTILAAAALMAAAAPATAQTRPADAPHTPVQTLEPGSEAWLRQRGQSYSAASEAGQDPTEVAITVGLNAAIVAGNEAAERTEAEAAARHEVESARWREEAARTGTARVQWEADVAAAEAARARYERDRAAWEAEVAACRSRGPGCRTRTLSPKT